MRLTLAILSSLAVAAILIAVVAGLRRLLIVRQLSFVLFVAAVAAGLRVFTLFTPGRFETFDHAMSWILLFLGSITVIRLAGLLYFDLHLPHRGVRLPNLLPMVTVGAAYFVAAIVTFKISFPDQALSGLVTGSAITSLVIGLALQPILGNIFAGVVIGLEKPYRINDWIKIGDVEGRVVSISWRTTHLRTRESDNLIVPNGQMADDRILNYYYPHPMHLEKIVVGADYKSAPYRVRQALLAAAQGVTGVLEKPTPDVYVQNFDDSSIRYELRVWIEDIGQRPRIVSDIRSRVWEEFKRTGIEIPFPIRTVEMAPRKRVAKGAAAPPTSAKLFVTMGQEAGAEIAIQSSRVTVGRARTCDLALLDSQASKEHIAIELQPEGFVLTDLETSNGTKLNGEAVKRAVLQHMDRIFIGDTVLVFEADGRE
ncbi:MAG: mechanosensitive ion channel domain-containing protein [Thermoanaerobaculia bacterium]